MTDTSILLSIIIPCLNEVEVIDDCLLPLQPLRKLGCEVIVVDGGSSDQTVELAEPQVDQLLSCKPGRARQMNLGASHARGAWLLFLHTDTRLPEAIHEWLDQLQQNTFQWGFFALRLSGRSWLLRIIENAITLRSGLTGIATGDQCQFVQKSLFEALQGFAAIELMEDVELSTRLRRIAKPKVWAEPVVSSSRRWEQNGIVSTVVLMWRLRLAYFLGVSPRELYKKYYG